MVIGYLKGLIHDLSGSHRLQLLVLSQPGLNCPLDLEVICTFPGLPMGLQLPFKRLHVPRQSGGGSFIRSSLLHRDGTASRKTAKDYHRRLCDQDDKGRKVDSSNIPHFHRSHSLHCCECSGETLANRPHWGTWIKDF